MTEIALAAKGYWGYPHHWLREWRDVLTITANDIRSLEAHVAIEDDAPVGFYILSGAGALLSLDHLWVAPAAIGRGIGHALFLHAERRAAALGADQMHIEADPHAEGFYLKMGAARAGERVYEIDGQARVLPVLLFNVSGDPSRRTR